MKLPLNEQQTRRVLAFLETDEDCERLPGNEYVADLYNENPPLTLNLSVDGGELVLLAAAQLLYDESLDAYYMGDPVENVEEIARALLRGAGGE